MPSRATKDAKIPVERTTAKSRSKDTHPGSDVDDAGNFQYTRISRKRFTIQNLTGVALKVRVIRSFAYADENTNAWCVF